MYLKLPQQYLINKFFQYTGYPVYRSSIKAYNACCPVCREGTSWGKKKRLFYFPQKDQFYCHNCAQGWSAVGWIKQVCGLSISQIQAEISSGIVDKPELEMDDISEEYELKSVSCLPYNSINLFDKSQVLYYKNNEVVRECLKLIKKRRLLTAINRCESLYISLDDFTHKNRLCIPFYDLNKNIIFYQTRSIFAQDSRPKYLSKKFEEKSVFNINRIDSTFPYIFILEGPIDAMFIKNGVAICGLTMTSRQIQQLKQFPMHKLIWCLDNQSIDNSSRAKVSQLLQRGETVLSWPNSLNYKDFNELCIAEERNEIDTEWVIDNSSSSIFTNLL